MTMELKVGKLYVRGNTTVMITALSAHPFSGYRYVSYRVIENDLTEGQIFTLSKGEFEYDYKRWQDAPCPGSISCGPCTGSGHNYSAEKWKQWPCHHKCDKHN